VTRYGAEYQICRDNSFRNLISQDAMFLELLVQPGLELSCNGKGSNGTIVEATLSGKGVDDQSARAEFLEVVIRIAQPPAAKHMAQRVGNML